LKLAGVVNVNDRDARVESGAVEMEVRLSREKERLIAGGDPGRDGTGWDER
jgi:hypothetical protein